MLTSSSSPVCILLLGAALWSSFFAFACWLQGVWNGSSVSMVVLLVVLSLGEECTDQADSFVGFCFHSPWQKMPLTFLCVLSMPVPCISCAFINSAFWTGTAYSF